SEIDVIIESPFWVWFIEAKYRGDIAFGTTTRADRDQVLRNVDVGTYYAGVRPFYFSLLVTSRERSPVGTDRVEAYSDLQAVRALLADHRPDGLRNLSAIGVLRWEDLHAVLTSIAEHSTRPDERDYAGNAANWLA